MSVSFQPRFGIKVQGLTQMLRMNRADASDCSLQALRILLAGPDFLGTAARDASDRHTYLSYETKKHHSPGARRDIANWSDLRNPVNPQNPDETSVSVASPSGFSALS
jgi:hypothetical protein